MTNQRRSLSLLVASLALGASALPAQQPENPIYNMVFRSGGRIQFMVSEDSVRVSVNSPGIAGLICERPVSPATQQWADSAMVAVSTPVLASSPRQRSSDWACGVAVHPTYLHMQQGQLNTIVPLDPIEYSVLRRLLKGVVSPR